MIYYRPSHLTECLELLRELPEVDCRILAGGTDLLPRMEAPASFPEHLIDIKGISDLHQISASKETLTIGALVTMEELRNDPTIQSEFAALHQALEQFAGVQIRNRATLGGNICNASPAGDCLPALYAFEAQVVLVGPRGQRQLPIRNFIQAPGRTTRHPHCLLHSIQLPRQGLDSAFFKLGLRDSMAISVVNLATVYELGSAGFTGLVMAAGAVGPTVALLDHFTQAILSGSELNAETLDLIDTDIAPIDDIRGTASYRSRVLKNICRAQLTEIMNHTLPVQQ